MKNNLLLGIVLGFGFFYVTEMYRKNKPCKCNDTEAPVDDSEKSSPNECEQAVDLVMSELRKTSRMSEEAFELRRAQELKKCIAMSQE